MQGKVIPNLLTAGKCLPFDLLACLALEDCGPSIDDGQGSGLLDRMQRALKAVHAKGIVHGDLELRHFTLAQDGSVRIIDFGRAERGSSAQCRAEFKEMFEDEESSQAR